MKAFNFLLLFTFFLCFTACDNDNDPVEEPPVEGPENTYVGKVTIDPDGENFFEKENTSIEIKELTATTIEMIIYDAKFASGMPAMDISIGGITIETVSSEIILSGDGIIPTMAGNGVAVERYTITNLKGKIKDGELTFTMMCGTFPFEYKGSSEAEVPPVEETENIYVGKVTIDPDGEDFFEKEDTSIEIKKLTATTIELIIYDAKFAEKMPAMDISIAGITTETTSSEIILSGEGIIPTVAANGLAVEMYTITNLEGNIKGDELTFTMMCGTYPFEYKGSLKK